MPSLTVKLLVNIKDGSILRKIGYYDFVQKKFIKDTAINRLHSKLNFAYLGLLSKFGVPAGTIELANPVKLLVFN